MNLTDRERVMLILQCDRERQQCDALLAGMRKCAKPNLDQMQRVVDHWAKLMQVRESLLPPLPGEPDEQEEKESRQGHTDPQATRSRKPTR